MPNPSPSFLLPSPLLYPFKSSFPSSTSYLKCPLLPIHIHQTPHFSPFCASLTAPPSRSTNTDSALNPSPKESSLYDVTVIGAGPAGLSLAASLGAQGLSVLVTDPKLDQPWPNHYGVWEDEFAPLGLSDCATSTYHHTSVFSDKNKTLLNRPYIRVDREKLKKRFFQRARDAGVQMHRNAVLDVKHPSASWSLVYLDADNLPPIRTRLVVDCTGHALQFSDNGTKRKQFDQPWVQAAYGVEARVADYPFSKDEMVLMDFRDDHITANLRAESNKRPTFLYVFPNGDKQAFFEETSVIAPTAIAFEELKERLMLRLRKLGVEIEQILEEEFSLIPMGGSLPERGRVVGFGGAACFVHPATGYMIARTMHLAESVSHRVAKELARVGEHGDIEEVSQAVWETTWSPSMLRQRDFLKFGAELLADLGIVESRSFFQAFFGLPRDLWTRFLSYELDSPQVRALFALWFFVVADNRIRIRLLRAVVQIGGWRLIRSILPVWLSSWQRD